MTCKDFQNGPVVRLGQSDVNPRGYYIRFIPKPNEYGVNYNKMSVILEDSNHTSASQFSLIYYYISILPVNDPPVVILTETGSPAVSGAVNSLLVRINEDVKVINSISDVDSYPGVSTMSLKISIEPSDPTKAEYIITDRGTTKILSSTYLTLGSVEEINGILSSLSFRGHIEGGYVLKVVVNDNGVSGGCPTGVNPQPDGSCPMEVTVIFAISASVDGLSNFITNLSSVGVGSLFIFGVGAAIFIARRIRNKQKDEGWREFEEDHLNDYVQSNPIFLDSPRGSNPLYVSSRESLELSMSTVDTPRD